MTWTQDNLFDRAEPPRETVGGDTLAVRELQCKSLLNCCDIDDYSFNCYTGCAHGCVQRL